MPKKLNDYSSYGQKLISLFAKLLFTGEKYSLTQLSQMLDCSKQTIIRLVCDIQRVYGTQIEESIQGNKRHYRLTRPGKAIPVIPLTESELSALHMCKTFTEHLLGNQFFGDAARALEKNLALTGPTARLPSRHFAAFSTGTIDYAPHQDKIHLLIDAMNASKICRVTYQAVLQKQAKTYHVKPLKIFSYRDTLYLHARKAREPGKVYKEPDFDPLLAIHRLKKVEMTDTGFEYPPDYDFEKVFDKNFGFIKDDQFDAEVEFTGWAAQYVAERMWSPNQQITRMDENKIRLTFSAASRVELIAWILSFGEEAKVVNPDWLVTEMKKKLKDTAGLYKNGN